MTSVTPRQPASAYSDIDEMRRRIRELIAVAAVLRPDRDDPRCLSELTVIEAELEAARRELSALRDERKGSR